MYELVYASIALIVLLVAGIVSLYNNLISAKNRVTEAFSGVDVMLKNRVDLIPNLIAATKKYMAHEQRLLSEITALRSKILTSTDTEETRFGLEAQLSQSLGSFQVAMETYPELKSNANFLQLQRTLNETEAQIAAARRAYNAAVNHYNNKVEMLPSNFIAAAMGYKTKASFQASVQARQNIDVNKLFD